MSLRAALERYTLGVRRAVATYRAERDYEDGWCVRCGIRQRDTGRNVCDKCRGPRARRRR